MSNASFTAALRASSHSRQIVSGEKDGSINVIIDGAVWCGTYRGIKGFCGDRMWSERTIKALCRGMVRR